MQCACVLTNGTVGAWVCPDALTEAAWFLLVPDSSQKEASGDACSWWGLSQQNHPWSRSCGNSCGDSCCWIVALQEVFQRDGLITKHAEVFCWNWPSKTIFLKGYDLTFLMHFRNVLFLTSLFVWVVICLNNCHGRFLWSSGFEKRKEWCTI